MVATLGAGAEVEAEDEVLVDFGAGAAGTVPVELDSGAGGAAGTAGAAGTVGEEALELEVSVLEPPDVATAVPVVPTTSATVIAMTKRSPPTLPGKSGLRRPIPSDTIKAQATSAPPTM
jgi:hypothetical protein